MLAYLLTRPYTMARQGWMTHGLQAIFLQPAQSGSDLLSNRKDHEDDVITRYCSILLFKRIKLHDSSGNIEGLPYIAYRRQLSTYSPLDKNLKFFTLFIETLPFASEIKPCPI